MVSAGSENEDLNRRSASLAMWLVIWAIYISVSSYIKIAIAIAND